MNFIKRAKVQTLVSQYYQAIDNFWSWVEDDDIYTRFRSFAPRMQAALTDSIVNVVETATFKDKELFSMFAMFQGVALSYYLTMELSNEFPRHYSIDYITKSMTEVFIEQGYLGNEKMFNNINEMIGNKEIIVKATQKKLQSGEGLTLD